MSGGPGFGGQGSERSDTTNSGTCRWGLRAGRRARCSGWGRWTWWACLAISFLTQHKGHATLNRRDCPIIATIPTLATLGGTPSGRPSLGLSENIDVTAGTCYDHGHLTGPAHLARPGQERGCDAPRGAAVKSRRRVSVRAGPGALSWGFRTGNQAIGYNVVEEVRPFGGARGNRSAASRH